ncbi:TPA: hypothetical protein ACIPB4_004135, partial [Salmonella enterica subsp. enterica serovar Waycross]
MTTDFILTMGNVDGGFRYKVVAVKPDKWFQLGSLNNFRLNICSGCYFGVIARFALAQNRTKFRDKNLLDDIYN